MTFRHQQNRLSSGGDQFPPRPFGWQPFFFRTSVFIILGYCLLAPGCTRYVPTGDPDLREQLPKFFSVNQPEFDPAWKWWKSFEDDELDTFIEQALTNNFTLSQAWFRLRQAEAVAAKIGAESYPDLTGSGQAARLRQRTTNGTETTRTRDDYALGFSSSYEVDLWGKIRSEQEAAAAEANATLEDFHAAAGTLVGEITERWVRIISQRNQKQLLESQKKTNETYLELIELRFRKSLSSALDVFQQQQILESVKAEIPLVEAQEKVLTNELYLLAGKPPGAEPIIGRQTLPVLTDTPSTGIPADLLANRPDVRAAGLRLMAAEYNLDAARADRLPSLSLTGTGRFGSDELDLLFDNWVMSLASALTAPLFDGGLRKAEVDRTDAALQEALNAYREKVLTAVKEVEDALVLENRQKAHVEALKTVIEVSRKALNEAIERYRNGLSDYLPVLTELLAVQGRERQIIQQQALLMIYRIDLYRALGGTWMTHLGETLRDETGLGHSTALNSRQKL
jgi:NodT family efflux transporter outer membrane factor (OMF) lipoprotein